MLFFLLLFSAAERRLSLAVYFSARIDVAICFPSRVATVEPVAPFAPPQTSLRDSEEIPMRFPCTKVHG
jgi:hypothetical protein